jgi:hypothetical protein
MKIYFFLPLSFLKFWFFEAPREMIWFFASLNRAFFQLFGLIIFVKTFFKPLKNEYRKGLVAFSRWMGMGIKSVLIVANLAIFIPLLILEITAILLFVAFPIVTLGLLFYDI